MSDPWALLNEVRAEMARQDDKRGPFTEQTKLGATRLAIACLEDEVAEAKDAWRGERKSLRMAHTREELIKVAAVAVRAVEALDGLEWPDA